MTNEAEEFRLEAENLDLRRLLAQAGIDAAEQKVAQKLQRIMVEELHHRVKNILATVQAITSQSLRAAHSVEEGRLAIESRLHALAVFMTCCCRRTGPRRSSRPSLEPASSRSITPAAPQIVMRSADIDVAPAAALPLAMVLNELCTNAVKYGALSMPTGRVDINATIPDKQPQLPAYVGGKGRPPRPGADPPQLRLEADRACLCGPAPGERPVSRSIPAAWSTSSRFPSRR